MAIKNKVVRWFIQSLLIPKRETIENPGFITEKISSREDREMSLPELLFEDLENKLKTDKKVYMSARFLTKWKYQS